MSEEYKGQELVESLRRTSEQHLDQLIAMGRKVQHMRDTFRQAMLTLIDTTGTIYLRAETLAGLVPEESQGEARALIAAMREQVELAGQLADEAAARAEHPPENTNQ